MNDYARVRSKNEKKKKQEKIVSLFFLIGSFLPSFLVRLGQVGGENKRRRRDEQKEKKKKKKKRRKKKERRIGRHSILSDRFKQHEA